MIKYSQSEHACYVMDFDYDSIPTDAVEITRHEHSLFMGNDIPAGKRLRPHEYPFVIEDVPALTPEQRALSEQLVMVKELEWCDLQIKLHQSSDGRAVSTLDDIFAYARSCRDYVMNLDGVLTIVGDKPSRPE